MVKPMLTVDATAIDGKGIEARTPNGVIELIMLLAMIEAYKDSEMAIVDIPMALMQSCIDETVFILIDGTHC